MSAQTNAANNARKVLRSFTKTNLAMAIFASTLGAAPSVLAQNATLDEIIISARKQLETIQDVPVSVATMGSEKIRESNITDLAELSFYMPNVSVTRTGSDDSLFIRGVGSGVNLGFERSVGTYVDGVYLGRGKQSRAAFLDLERVEILKGPQGILFGKNTIAGALNITSAEPTDELGGYLEVLYEPDANEMDNRFAISNSVSDHVRARLAGRYHTMDGYLTNTNTGDDEPEIDEYALRGTVIWDVSSELEVAFRVENTHSEIDGSNLQLYRVDPIKDTDASGKVIGPTDARLDDKSDLAHGVGNDSIDNDDIDSELYSLTLSYDLDDYTFTSITAFSGYEAIIDTDADYSPRDSLSRHADENFTQASQELRVLFSPDGPLEYLAGLYYEETNLDIDEGFTMSALAVPFPGSTWQHELNGDAYAPVAAASGVNSFEQDSTTLALFGQVTWNISDSWRWNVGLRYGRDEKDMSKDVNVIPDTTVVAPYQGAVPGTLYPVLLPSLAASYNISEDRSNEEVTWSSNLQYDISDDVMAYWSMGTGYKDGGYDQFYLGSYSYNPFSPQSPLTPVNSDDQSASLEFAEETVESIELGLRSSLLNGAMTLNAAIFRSEFEDLQTSALEGATFKVVNAGSSVSQGVEVDARLAVTSELTVGVAMSYLDAYYSDFEDAACTAEQTAKHNVSGNPGGCNQDLTDAPLQFAPELSGNFNVSYATSIFSSLVLRVTADVNYTDAYFTTQDEDPYTEVSAYTKLNMRIGLADTSDSWEVAIVGKNLTDKTTASWINDTPLNVSSLSTVASNSFFARTDRPRTIAIQGIYRF